MSGVAKLAKPRVARIDDITKPEFESCVKGIITDSQWDKIADEIEGRANNFIDELLANVIQDYKEGAYDE
jgi:hypothetical protein